MVSTTRPEASTPHCRYHARERCQSAWQRTAWGSLHAPMRSDPQPGPSLELSPRLHAASAPPSQRTQPATFLPHPGPSAACELFLELRELPALRLTPEAAGAAAQRECVGVGGLAGGGPAGGWERAPRTRADCLGPGSAQPAAGTALGGAEGSGDQDGTPLVRSSGTTREADPSGSGRGTGAGARVPLVVFATNSGGSRLYGVCAGGDGGGGGRGGGGEGGGEVFVLRGLMTTRRVAGSVSGFLARLVA